MKIHTPSKKSLIVIISSVVALIACGLVVFYLVQRNASDTNTDMNATNKPTQQELDEDAKQAAEDKQDFLDEDVKNDDNTSTPPAVVTNDTLSLSASQTDSSLVVTTRITDFSGEGTCSLTVSKAGEASINETADILYQPEFSSCAGFSIDKNRLTAGTWNVSLTTTIAGESYTKSINYTIE